MLYLQWWFCLVLFRSVCESLKRRCCVVLLPVVFCPRRGVREALIRRGLFFFFFFFKDKKDPQKKLKTVFRLHYPVFLYLVWLINSSVFLLKGGARWAQRTANTLVLPF